MRQLLIIIFAKLLLSSCTIPKKDTSQVNPPLKQKDTTVISNENEEIFNNLNSQDVLNKLFDSPIMDSNETAIWKPNYYERMTFPVSYDGKCHSNIDTIMYFTDGSNRKCACVIITNFNYRKGTFDDSTKVEIGDCHFCGVPLGIALFSQTNSMQWELYKFEKIFTTLGYFGVYKTGRESAGKISLKKIGNNWTCLSLLQGVGGNGGYLEGYENLYSIEQFQIGGFPNNVLSCIFSNTYYSSNIDAGIPEKDREEVKTELRTIEKGKDYFDIDLISISKGKSTTKHYHYSDEYNQFVEK